MSRTVCLRQGCRGKIAYRRSDADYCSDACSKADRRALGGPRPRTAESPDKARTRKPAAPRLSYRKAVDAVADLLRERAGDPPAAARVAADDALRPLLGPKARSRA